MTGFCSNCLKDPLLVRATEQAGRRIELCAVCSAGDVFYFDSDDSANRGLFRALVRWHYSEWAYNSHLGGDHLELLLMRENPLINYMDDWDAEVFQDALLPIIEEGYETEATPISLFAGYDHDGNQNQLLPAIKTGIDGRIRSLSHSLRQVNYFQLETRAARIVSHAAQRLARGIAQGSEFWRARIGSAASGLELHGFGDHRHYRPYSGSAISAPPPLSATAGRANRAGVSFLYVATDLETAVSEVRPHPGHHVSVGLWRTNGNLQVLALDAASIDDYADLLP
jgi:RES domain-containing protein